MDKTLTVAQLYGELEVLKGKAPWEVGRAMGSFLMFYFGKKVSAQSGKSHGEWGLAVYSPWVMQTDTEAIITSNEDQSAIDEAIRLFEGIPFHSASVSPPSLDTTLFFENDLQLRIFPAKIEEYGQSQGYVIPTWSFSHSDRFIIAVQPDNQIIYEPSRQGL